MKRIFLFGALLITSIALTAQPVITFSATEHNFGQIEEAGGRVSTEFTFTNEGDQPLVLSNVRASCGCTTPTFTRTPVEPGKTGTITVTYNPNGRPGRFQKSITITSNASNPTTKLYIKGEVIPKEAQPTEKYPVKIDGIGLDKRIVPFGTVLNTAYNTKTIEYANLTDKPIQISVFTNTADEFLQPIVTLETVQPKQSGSIQIYFDAKKCNEFGSLTRDFYIGINGKRVLDDAHKITINAFVKEDFSKLTPQQRQQAPIVEIAQRVDLGTLHTGQEVSKKLAIKNAGVNALLLRKVSCRNSSGLTAKPAKASIKGGKTSTLNLTLNTTDLAIGSYTRQVEIITNDPNRSRLFVTVTWKIE